MHTLLYLVDRIYPSLTINEPSIKYHSTMIFAKLCMLVLSTTLSLTLAGLPGKATGELLASPSITNMSHPAKLSGLWSLEVTLPYGKGPKRDALCTTSRSQRAHSRRWWWWACRCLTDSLVDGPWSSKIMVWYGQKMSDDMIMVMVESWGLVIQQSHSTDPRLHGNDRHEWSKQSYPDHHLHQSQWK